MAGNSQALAAMSTLRIISWNCRSGSLSARFAQLAPLSPDLVFVQECRPAADLPVFGQLAFEPVNRRKAVAIGALSDRYRITRIPSRPDAGRAVIAVSVEGPFAFNLLGIWAIGPRYSADVLASLAAYEDVLQSSPTVIVGDLNSGPSLAESGGGKVTTGHAALVRRFESLGFVSAYHAFHKLPHGGEQHSSYRHLFAPGDRWHIDFCFVPEAWAPNLERVEFLDDDASRLASDHHPLLVDLSS